MVLNSIAWSYYTVNRPYIDLDSRLSPSSKDRTNVSGHMHSPGIETSTNACNQYILMITGMLGIRGLCICGQYS